MTDKELILNFINQYDRPFNAELVSKMTSVSREAIEKLLPELLQGQSIKQIEDDPLSMSELTATRPGSGISTTRAGHSA